MDERLTDKPEDVAQTAAATVAQAGLELRPTTRDVVIYDCQRQSDADLMAAVLNSHAGVDGDNRGGTK